MIESKLRNGNRQQDLFREGGAEMDQSFGIVRRMNLSGGIVIPSEIRNQLGWEANPLILICPCSDHVLLRTAPETETPSGLRELTDLFRQLNLVKQDLVLRLARYYAKNK